MRANRPITDAGHRVTPEDLISYRASGFRRPCCLCAVPKLDGASIGYTESTVVLAVDGENSGHFVSMCAGNNCAYQGQIKPTINNNLLTFGRQSSST